jgi:hypothetical protein
MNIFFDKISILDSALIDSESYKNDQYYTLLEYQSILKNIHFKIVDKDFSFDSSIDDPMNLDFNLCVDICGRISEHLNLKTSEIEKYEKDLKNPNIILPEKIIANLINNKILQLNYQDIKNMTAKEYEKLQLAILSTREK